MVLDIEKNFVIGTVYVQLNADNFFYNKNPLYPYAYRIVDKIENGKVFYTHIDREHGGKVKDKSYTRIEELEELFKRNRAMIISVPWRSQYLINGLEPKGEWFW